MIENDLENDERSGKSSISQTIETIERIFNTQ